MVLQMTCSPVDRFTGETITFIITLTSAVNNQSCLYTVCVLVTPSVILRAQVWSCKAIHNVNKHVLCEHLCEHSRLF